MADAITPSQPITPTLPVANSADDERREKQQPSSNDNEQKKTDPNNGKKKTYKGLFDEYV